MGLTAAVLVVWPLWTALGWWCFRRRADGLRALGSLALAGLSLSLPLMVWDSHGGVRMLAAVLSILMVGKLGVVVNRGGGLLSADANLRDFMVWAGSLPEGRRSKSHEEAVRLRFTAQRDFGRCVFKGLILYGMLMLNSVVAPLDLRALSTLWAGLFLYLVFSGLRDGLAALHGWLGVHVPPLFDNPLVAASPREFWGRRWNLWFTSTAHDLMFRSISKRFPSVLGAGLVFGVSAVLHEWIVIAGMHQFDGRMLAFFGLHFLAATLQSEWRGRIGYRWPRSVSVVLHFAWLWGSAPLFMDPVDDVLGLSTWTLASIQTFFLQ